MKKILVTILTVAMMTSAVAAFADGGPQGSPMGGPMDGQPPRMEQGQQVPEMTPEVVNGITDRYIELYERITGVPFVKAEDEDLAARIEKNVMTFLKSL